MVEFFEYSQIKGKDISFIKIQLIHMFQNRIISELQVPIMSVLYAPGSAMLGELAVVNLYFCLGLHIFPELL
jgi:hypothetical protein